MSLRRAISFGSIQTVVSLVVGFFSVKITSVYLGPAGVGILGQMQHLIHLMLGIVGTGLKTGIVRRTAELGNDQEGRVKVVATILKLALVLGLPVAVIVLAASGWLAEQVLHDASFRVAVIVLAICYGFGLVGTLIVGCANGARDYKSTTLINVSTAITNLILFAVLCPTFGLMGALISVALMPLLHLCIGAVLARRAEWWPSRPWAQSFVPLEAKRALAFVPAATIGAVAAPLIQILLRDNLAARSGAVSVGLLQGVSRISEMYLGIVVSIFSMYFLPRFAQIKIGHELKTELKRALLLIVPALSALSLLFYLFRDLLISIVFTGEFAAMRDLFGWQMLGNVFKMIGWLFGYVLMAKAHPAAVTAFEAASLVIWFALGVLLINVNGAVGATQAYALTYLIYAAMGVGATALIVRKMR